ncbi:Ser/Thr protein kinase RdoA (MazF antagonist) [Curtobacterium sp. PhB130]|nr:Ser/Thr protein kinase RdoA (MazF antagonist) [Curtobacterium sp. PhB130]
MLTSALPGERVETLHLLPGGLATDAYHVRTTDCDIVVKVFRKADPRAELEWARLEFAQRINLPIPKPIALDLQGSWFGSPALVMSCLDGKVELNPPHLDTWLDEVANTLAEVHRTDIAGAGPVTLSSRGVGHWSLLPLERSGLVGRATAALERTTIDGAEDLVLMHGDFHPGNVLWKDGVVSAVVDWSASRVGPRWFEVAYSRADIALLFGLGAARRFTNAYVAKVGCIPVHLAAYDLMCGLVAQHFSSRWLGAFRDQGCRSNEEKFAERAKSFLLQALDQLDT